MTLDTLSPYTIEQLRSQYWMLGHAIDGILSGTHEAPSREEIGKMVGEHFLGFIPLIQLTQKQEMLLREVLVNYLAFDGDMEGFGEVAGDLYIREDMIGSKGGPIFVTGNPVYYQRKKMEAILRKLTVDEKLRYFFLEKAWQIGVREDIIENGGGSSGSWNKQGNRHIEEYTIHDVWDEVIAEVRKNTKKESLRILDVGCGIGLALTDIKNKHPDFETHGITLEQEPGMSDGVDYFHYHAAERIPKEFLNAFDIIITETSFRYYLFPHIALRNSVLALAPGGKMIGTFSYERPPMNEKYLFGKETIARCVGYFSQFAEGEVEGKRPLTGLQELVRREFEVLQELDRKGKIRLNISEKMISRNFQGRVDITKLQNIDPEEFT